jgi:hypothetical protein
MDDDFGAEVGYHLVDDAFVGKVSVGPFERVDLVSSVSVTQLLHEGAPDEPRGSRDQGSHRGRVYWRASVLLFALLLLPACHGSKRPTPKPGPRLSFKALDRQQQRLVADYEPVSRALTAYELDYREWRLGRRSKSGAVRAARRLAARVKIATARLRHDRASGATAEAKRLLIAALEARRSALAAAPDGKSYQRDWDRAVVDARRALTLMQDIRDRARLIPLPEDSIS